MKHFFLFILAKLIEVIFIFFKILGPKNSSKVGSILISYIGPLTIYQTRAKKNIDLVFPQLKKPEKEKIIKGMWKNLGQTLGELSHLNDFNPYTSDGTEIIGRDILDKLLLKNKGIIFFSAHIANWEVGSISLTKSNLRPLCIYRKSNNIYLDKVIQNLRKNFADYVPKGDTGAKRIFLSLRKGNPVAFLMDQKLNEGILADFLGIPAKTAPAIAELSIRLNVDIVPVKIERKGYMKFRITFLNPIKMPSVKLLHKTKVKIILNSINNLISKWILEKPEEWLWIHRRWPDDYYKNN